MGGLRKKIPWTFWTMTAGTFAIAGIPPLAGFFSKDEILWHAYAASAWIYWGVGVFTAFLNFVLHVPAVVHDFLRRISRRRAESHGHGGHGHDAHGHDSHGHGTVHESPGVMLVPLVDPCHSFGRWRMGRQSATALKIFLRLSFIRRRRSARTASTPRRRPRNQCQLQHCGRISNPAPKSEESEKSTELLFTGISVGAGLLGFFLAWLLYYRRPELPAEIAATLGGLYYTVAQ